MEMTAFCEYTNSSFVVLWPKMRNVIIFHSDNLKKKKKTEKKKKEIIFCVFRKSSFLITRFVIRYDMQMIMNMQRLFNEYANERAVTYWILVLSERLLATFPLKRVANSSGKYDNRLLNVAALFSAHPPPFQVLYWATTQGFFLSSGLNLCSTCT